PGAGHQPGQARPGCQALREPAAEDAATRFVFGRRHDGRHLGSLSRGARSQFWLRNRICLCRPKIFLNLFRYAGAVVRRVSRTPCWRLSLMLEFDARKFPIDAIKAARIALPAKALSPAALK